MIPLLAFLLIAPISVNAEDDPPPAPDAALLAAASAPPLTVHFLQKNQNGETYQLGDRITLYVEVSPELSQSRANLEIKIPEGGSDLADQGWYLDPTPQLISGNLRFIVSPLQPGKLTLPMLLILKEDQSVVGRTTPISIQVAEIKKTQETPPLLTVTPMALPTRYLILFIALGLLLIVLIVYLIRRWQAAKRARLLAVPAPVIKKESDHVLAIRNLDKLYLQYPFRNDNMKPIAFGVSEVLKSYFSSRFQIDANEATTDEMIALLQRESVPRDGLKEIQALFNDLDFIKFTKNTTTDSANEAAYYAFKVKALAIIHRWTGPGEAP